MPSPSKTFRRRRHRTARSPFRYEAAYPAPHCPHEGNKGVIRGCPSAAICALQRLKLFSEYAIFYGAETVPCPESDMARFISTYKDYPYTD